MNNCILITVLLAVKYHLFDDIEEESSSDSDDEVSEVILFKRIKKAPHRITNYVEHTIERFTPSQFQQNFRITIDKFNLLLELLGPTLKRSGYKGRNTIDVPKQILSVLWLLATPDSYRSVGERFNLGKSSLSRCFVRVIKALCQLAPIFIKWPSIENERLHIKEGFKRMGGIPNVIGAVDGTFINIKAPKHNPEVYVTRKCTYAITLQAICDNNLKFTDIFVGYPGSVSDCRIFRNSDIFIEVENNTANYFVNDEFIIGDKAYPLLDWCIPPYINRGNMTPAKIYFNQQHAKTRQTIERAFALLFGRFRRLKYLDMNKFELIPATVLASCILHNICLDIEHDNDFIEEGALFLVEQNNVAEYNNEAQNPNVHNIDNWEKRENICRRLFLQRTHRNRI